MISLSELHLLKLVTAELADMLTAGRVAASRKLRNEGERPTRHPEAMAGAVGVQRDVSGAPAPLFEISIDRKSQYFYLETEGSI